MRRAVVSIILILLIAVEARKLTDEEYLSLPRLFHLDDYDRCLKHKNGVYCTGQFQIYTDDGKPNPVYDLIQEHSQDPTNYNRTFLHRGYCLNTRCPSTETNATARFERCVDQWARSKSLRTRLLTLYSCRTNKDMHTPKGDTPQRLFLFMSLVILLMNVVGTVYDYKSEEKDKKRNPLLMAWSMRSNWNKYVSVNQPTESRLEGFDFLEGLRFYLFLLLIFIHENIAINKGYHYEALENEEFLKGFIPTFFKAVISLAQIFIMIFIFLSTYNILLTTEKRRLSMKRVLQLFLKKVARLWPLYMFTVAFAATWFSNLGDGPVWSVVAETESNICRAKIWPQIFFLQNFFMLDVYCLPMTWILAVEIQLHLMVLIIIWVLQKFRSFNLRVLSLIYGSFMFLIFFEGYKHSYKPTVQYNTPENALALLANSPSFTHFYSQPLSHSLTAVAGIMLAYLQYNTRMDKIKREKVEWIFSRRTLWYWCTFGWAFVSMVLQQITGDVLTALFLVVDRVALNILWSLCLYSSMNTKTGHLHWKGWRFFSRLTYGISLWHWPINLFLVGVRRTLIPSGVIITTMYAIVDLVISTIVSLPLLILVELPLQGFLNTLINKVF